MVDTSIIMQAGRPTGISVPDILQSGARTVAELERAPIVTENMRRQAEAQQQDRQAQEALRKGGIMYNYAKQLRALPMAQRRTFLNTIPEQTISDLGIDPQQLQGMPLDDASIDTSIAQLEPLMQMQQGARDTAPAELQTFEALTQGLTDEEVAEAKRVRLGLGARAKGSKQVEIGGVPYILDQDSGTLTPVEVGGQQVTAETVGESKGRIESEKTRAVESAKDVQEFISEAAPKIAAIESNIKTYDEVIQAIDEGARTGAVVARLPSINEASKSLDNLRIRLGLDVVSMASFGALSESEMNIALSSALPTNKEPAALRKWVVDKQKAQRKAADAMRDAVSFLNNGGTIAELIELGGKSKPAKDVQDVEVDDFAGFELVEE